MYAKQSIYVSITSHTRAKVFITAYMSQVKELTKLIYSFIKCDDNDVFEDKSVKKDDINFLFLRYVENAFLGDIIQPAEMALINMCREVDSHFTYTVESNTVSVEDNDVDGEDDEAYEELGSIDHTDEYE